MDLEIKENVRNNGYCCEFTFNGKSYYADIANTFDAGNECMIFEIKNGIIDWCDLYCNRNVIICEKDLEECIEKFIQQLESEK